MSSPAEHAILSPSSAARWLACTPSARLELDLPDKSSEAAEEGTLAHAIAEDYTNLIADNISFDNFISRLREHRKHRLYKKEMDEHCENFAKYVIELLNTAKKTTSDAFLETEQKVDLTEWVPGSFGTVDNTIIADEYMYITDFKYGKGIKVSAIENKQLMLYALGALHKYDFVYDISRVVMTIYQPRLDHIESFEMSVEELRAWGEKVKILAEFAFKGEGDLVPGEHCTFCKVLPTCRAQAQRALKAAKKEFALPPTLNDTEIAELLTELDPIMKWAKKVQQYAFDKAMEGYKWNGWKLVHGRSVRTYADENLIVAELKNLGFKDEDIYNTKLKGITDMTKAIGKKEMDRLENEDLIIKPLGKPTLVPESDKRPEIQTKESAIADFAN